jgi:membrane associated rhomboid family serine protease
VFFIIPVGVDYRANRYPTVTFTLIGINVVVFVLSILFAIQGGGRQWELQNLWLVPAHSSAYAYVTSAFVHSGLLHLVGNMAYLYLFGACVEDVIGRWRFVVFYVLGILSSSFLYVFLSGDGPRSEVPMGGASGAVSACIGGFLVLMARTKVEFKWIFFLFLRVWSGEWFLPAWLPISLWFLSDLLGMLADAVQGEGGGGVAFAAHVGGTLGGVVMIAAYKKFFGIEEETVEPTTLEPPPLAKSAPIRIQGPPATYLFHDGNQSGPYRRAQLMHMAKEGTISADAQFWEEGMPEWRPISELDFY